MIFCSVCWLKVCVFLLSLLTVPTAFSALAVFGRCQVCVSVWSLAGLFGLWSVAVSVLLVAKIA
jgi:hypothetical protein